MARRKKAEAEEAPKEPSPVPERVVGRWREMREAGLGTKRNLDHLLSVFWPARSDEEARAKAREWLLGNYPAE